MPTCQGDYFVDRPQTSDEPEGTTARTPASTYALTNVGSVLERIPTTIPDEEGGVHNGGDLGVRNSARPPEPSNRRALSSDIRGPSQSHYPLQQSTTNVTDRANAPARRPQTLDRQGYTDYPQRGWADEAYYEDNPWYDAPARKPVFSLGKPLPHVVRRRRRRVKHASPKDRGDEEQGQLIEDVPEVDVPEGDVDDDASTMYSRRDRQSQSRLGDDTLDNRIPQSSTIGGVAHSNKRNEAGLPVFEYVPGPARRTDSGLAPQQSRNSMQQPERVQSGASKSAPSFKIDGEPIGHHEHPEVERGEKSPDELRNWWARVRARHPEPLAEFLATGMALFLGLCGTLSVNLSQSLNTTNGSFETSCWSWGFGWMFGIYLGGGVSGAHLNPAVSLSFSIFRGFPWRSCAVYVCAQFIASIAAAGLAYGCYADAIHQLDPDMSQMSKAFFTTPKDFVTVKSAFLNQVVGGAIMMIAIFALGDDQNNPPGAGMHAFILGLLVTTLKFTLGFNVGTAINPAIDFGPRVIAYVVGYREHNVFGTCWWIYGPFAATLIGSMLGCVIYDGCIFVGSESPINYRMQGSWKEKTRRFWSPFVPGSRKKTAAKDVDDGSSSEQ
ncbi:aquaporin-like protein [Emericellopsis atlantica]|uniref:Aquaporin-like protein n=1 Tax=Emericellopsis atlantica TaxID=2614577 RepID=A0A9P8CQL6_9HYPO|nr:aquaporin-like protein [Emericellopsis atlantica]KAG9255432.1 aquaporin-like protein [Emericellopsis atlantica]